MGFSLNNLCTPAYVYLVISVISVIIMGFQNYGNSKIYCLGDYSCEVGSTAIIFGIKVMVVLLWTWILNLICKEGFPGISWFLVLLPFLLGFIMLAFMFI